MLDILKELEAHKLDRSRLTLETLTAVLPSYFKSPGSDAIYRWAAIPGIKSWGIVIYLCLGNRRTIHHQFIYEKLETSICHMLAWLLDNGIISYHQIIELL